MAEKISKILNERFKDYLNGVFVSVVNDRYYNLIDISCFTRISPSRFSKIVKHYPLLKKTFDEERRQYSIKGSQFKKWYAKYVKEHLSSFPQIYDGYLWVTKDAAEIIGIHPNTLVHYKIYGKIKPIWCAPYKNGSSDLYTWNEIEHFKKWYYNTERIKQKCGRYPNWYRKMKGYLKNG